MCDDSPD